MPRVRRNSGVDMHRWRIQTTSQQHCRVANGEERWRGGVDVVPGGPSGVIISVNTGRLMTLFSRSASSSFAMPLSAAEQQREANIQRNKELLLQLGIGETRLVPTKPVVEKPKRVKKPKAQKRKNDATEDEERPAKAPRLAEPDAPTGDESGRRRSGRNAGKKVDYVAEHTTLARPALISSAAAVHEDEQRNANKVGKRTHNPYVLLAIGFRQKKIVDLPR